MENIKLCSMCKTEKPISEFYPGNRCRFSYCKDCHKERAYKWRQANPEKNRRTYRNHFCKKLYGITLEEKEAMIVAQGNKYAICNTDKPGGRWNYWHVDHDHATNKVRAILCHKCNNALGCVKDGVDILNKMIVYLTKHSNSNTMVAHA